MCHVFEEVVHIVLCSNINYSLIKSQGFIMNKIYLFTILLGSSFPYISFASTQTIFGTPNIQGKVVLVEENGKLQGKVTMMDANGKIMGYKTIDAKQEISAIEDKLNEIKSDACSYKYKPISVTVTGLFVSFTWDTKDLCD